MKLSQIKGKKFKCIKEYGGKTIEDIPQIREGLIKQINEYNLNEKDVSKHVELSETDSTFEISNSNQYLIKPKIHKITEGSIEFRKGGDYIFHYKDSVHPFTAHKSYGIKLKASMLNGNILTVDDNLTYTIETE